MEERPSGAEFQRSRRARRWRRVAAAGIALVALPLVVIRIPAVSTPLVNAVAIAINPYAGTRISIERVSGGFLGGFELRGVRLVKNDGTPMLDVEMLRASYWLPALLFGRVDIGRIDVAGAHVRARQHSAGEWDWLAPFVTDSPSVEEPSGRAWRVDVESIRIERSRLEAHALDSMAAPLRVEDLEVRLGDVRLPGAVAFDLDTLGARVFVPDLPDSAAHVAVAASLRDDVLRVGLLRLHSAVSDVTGGGVISLPGLSIDRLRDVDFMLRAAPLDFRDIAPFVPALSSRPSLELNLRASSVEEWVAVSGGATLDDGAALSLDGGFWLSDGPVHWRLAADLSDLDPGHVLRDPVVAGPVDARLELELSGPARDRLSGQAELHVGRLDIGELTLLPASITALFDDGLARVEGALEVASIGRADVSGSMRPLAATPEFDVRVDVAQAPGDRLDAGVAVTDLDASLAVRWTGLAVDSLRADAQLDLNAVRLNDLAIDRGAAADLSLERFRIDASLRDGRLAANADVRSNGGDLAAELDARPFQDTPVFDVREIRLVDVDLARLGGPASRIDSRATLHGEGLVPATMRLDGSITVDSSHIGNAVINGIRADYALAAGSLRVTTSARALGGDVELTADARPFDATPTFTIALDPVRDIDLASLTGGRARTALSGSVQIDGAGRDAGSLELDAVANLAGAVNRGRITRGRLGLGVTAGRAELEAGIETQDGELDIRGDATWSDAPSLPVSSASASSSDPRRDPAHRPPHVTRWSIDATSRLPDLGDLAGLPDEWAAALEATVSGRGSGSTRETLTFDLRSTLSGELADLSVDSGRIEIAGRGGAAHVDTLRIDANAFSAAGGGVALYGQPRGDAPDSSDASLRIQLHDAMPLAGLVSAGALTVDTATLEARLGGPWAAQAFDIALHARNAAIDRIATGEVDVRAEGILGAGALDSADASLRLTELAAGHLVVDSARVTTRYRRAERLPIALALGVEGGRGLSATASLDPENLDAGLVIEQAQMRLPDETWSLSEPARIAWADALEVDSLFLMSGGRRLGADGRIEPKGELAFRIQIDSIGVASFSDMLGFPELDGWVSGRLRLEGPAAMARLHGVFQGRLGDRDGAMASLHATLGGDGKALGVTTSLDDDDDRRLTFSGFMPLRLSFDPDRPVEDALAEGRFGLSVRADSVSTGWLLPFVRPFGVTELDGALVIDAGLNGTAAAPSLRGSAQFVGGSVVMPELGVHYADVTAGAELGGRGIRVSADARSGGTARVRGAIELDELRLGRLDMQSEFDRFHVLTNDLTRFTMSGNVNVVGTTEAPQITGRVRVLDTDFFLDDAAQGTVSSVELTQQDLDMLRDYFGYVPSEGERAQRDPLEPIALDLAVQFGEDVWAQRRVDPRMTLLLAGSLDVRKAAGDSIQLFGTIETVPERSFFRQFRRRFQVTRGEVTFNGYIPTWRVDIASTYAVPARDADARDIEIMLAVQGGQEDLELTLGSDPSMEAPDIISYLATGRPAASAVAFGENGGIAETGVSLAIGSAAGLLEKLGADRIGLDVVEVRRDGGRGATLVGGRFLSSRVYVGFQQPILLGHDLEGGTRQETTRVELEYAAYRWLLANVQGGAGTMSVFLRVRRAY